LSIQEDHVLHEVDSIHTVVVVFDILCVHGIRTQVQVNMFFMIV
jgi:hypothetical protein